MSKLYLGKYHANQQKFELDPDDFTTHGVILGMTGSGKTGLAIGLLEELVLAKVPLILIDPKGDLTNLAFQFPQLQGSDFAPWVDPQIASQENLTVEAMGDKLAQSWREGLTRDEVPLESIATLKESLDYHLYTPGNSQVQPLNVLGNLNPPPNSSQDPELRANLINGLVQSILSLVGKEYNPIKDAPPIVLSNIFEHYWSQGQNLTLEDLIAALVDPPFEKVGVFPLDTFYPPDKRMELALELNGLISSPTFSSWKMGPTLHLDEMMTVRGNKVPVHCFYLAHLSEQERMFFVTYLMEQILAWSRTLSGSSKLRALVYFDEVAGYLPPYPKNPPCKRPILTILKQARAVGVGTILATQNPIDVDYKALSNTGTWMLGRLQTKQDRERVISGLTSASGGVDSKKVGEMFDQLQSRQFICKQAKENTPSVFGTRWVRSYLKGPLSTSQLPQLLEWTEQEVSTESPAESGGSLAKSSGAPENAGKQRPQIKKFPSFFLDPRQVFSARLKEAFTPYQQDALGDGKLLWQPAVYLQAELLFDETKGGSFQSRHTHHRVYFPLENSFANPLDLPELEASDILNDWEAGDYYENLPAFLDEEKEWKQLKSTLQQDIYLNVTQARWCNPTLKLYATRAMEKEEFIQLCITESQNQLDAELVKLEKKFSSKIDKLEDKVEKQEDRISSLEDQAGRRQKESWLQTGEAILGFFTGRKRSLTTLLRGHNRSSTAQTKADQATLKLTRYQEDIEELQEELEEKIEALKEEFAEKIEAVEQSEVSLDKQDIIIQQFGLLWVPVSKRI